MITENRIISANLGDSRAVLYRLNPEDSKLSPLSLTRDHKPSDADEKLRITNAGGRVFPYEDRNGVPVGPD
jgi:serine/threonine protein phosphatase PrpC